MAHEYNDIIAESSINNLVISDITQSVETDM